jgi:hypothetical protein
MNARNPVTTGKLHADDTPVPVLAPGQGRTKTGRLWTYVRDDRPAGDPGTPAVWFAYSPDRKGEHPAQHLEKFRGTDSPHGKRRYGKLDRRLRESRRSLGRTETNHFRIESSTRGEIVDRHARDADSSDATEEIPRPEVM